MQPQEVRPGLDMLQLTGNLAVYAHLMFRYYHREYPEEVLSSTRVTDDLRRCHRCLLAGWYPVLTYMYHFKLVL